MEKQTSSFISWEKLREIDLVGFLTSIGHDPTKTRGPNWWYLSPLRNEKTPSFKVNRRLNRWYDFGMSKGGTIIDFCLEYYKGDFQEIIQLLAGHIDLPPKQILQQPVDESPIKVDEEKLLTSLALSAYLKTRQIPVDLAAVYLSEIRYTCYNKSFFALGFKNDQGGYEIRNQFFKGSSSPKAVTTVKNGLETLSVFEGFFDFLSYLAMRKKMNWPETDYLILNSLSFLDRSLEQIVSYKSVKLYLDNDTAGRKAAAYLLAQSPIAMDCSFHYSGVKDLSDFWISKQLARKKVGAKL